MESGIFGWARHLPKDRRLASWLSGEGSLTARIGQRCGAFQLRRITQYIGAALPDERLSANLEHGRGVMVREIMLLDGAEVLVFAHSVVARRHLMGPWRGLRSLGGRPLADMLYADRRVSRDLLRYCQLSAADPLSRRLRNALPDAPMPLWARRSVFKRHGAPLLVTEVFLPAILKLKP